MFAKIGPKLHTGGKLTEDEMKEFAIGASEDDDDDEDSEYEYNGGDMSLYDSRIDDVDEIQFLKQSINEIHASNQQQAQQLMSGIADPE